MMSVPALTWCLPWDHLTLWLLVKLQSLRNAGFHPSGLPRSAYPVTEKNGMPLSRRSEGLLVPGSPRTVRPIFVPKSGVWPYSLMRVKPTLPSTTRVGESVKVWPTVTSCTNEWKAPRPPSQLQSPMALPKLGSPWNTDFMALYFAKIVCLEVRFQSTLASKSLRFRRCVADEKKLFV